MTSEPLGNSTSYLLDPAPRPGASLTAAPAPVLFDPARSALLVVDMQNDFLHPDGWFPRTGRDTSSAHAIVPDLLRLTAAFRAAGRPVIWVNWGVRPDAADVPPLVKRKASLDGRRPAYGDPSPSGRGRVLVAGDWGAETIAELAPQPQDLVLHKQRFSGFHATALDALLRGRGITTLFFAGINTDRCVLQSLTDAAALGYGCVLVEDACATLSPDSVRDAALYLVRLLHGATATVSAVRDALAPPVSSAAATPAPSNR
jgi:nicotinamidase-related amidase